MRMATMSVLGLYNYDNTLFDNMDYPIEFGPDEQNLFVQNCVMELAELEVIYPNPSFMKFAIGAWSSKERLTWDRIWEASQQEYNPIENYDRQESTTDVTDGTRQHTGTDTTTNTGTDTTTNTGTDTTTNSGKDTTQDSGTDSTGSNGSVTNTGNDVTTNKIAAFNSNTLVDHDSSTLAHGHGQTTSDTTTVTHGLKQELTHGHVEALQHGHTQALQHGHIQATQHGEKIDDDITVTRSSRIHGNIGVTTSQQMLEQELLVRPKLNMINIMIESFKNRFCVLVY